MEKFALGGRALELFVIGDYCPVVAAAAVHPAHGYQRESAQYKLDVGDTDLRVERRV